MYFMHVPKIKSNVLQKLRTEEYLNKSKPIIENVIQ